jgi:hypothetical protein
LTSRWDIQKIQERTLKGHHSLILNTWTGYQIQRGSKASAGLGILLLNYPTNYCSKSLLLLELLLNFSKANMQALAPSRSPEMLFNKISISSECNDLQYLNELASHGIYSKCVRELICPSWTYDSFGLALEKPRMDFNDLRGGYYFGSSALHMYPETFQQTVQAFSNIETLRLSLDVFQHPMSGVWRPFSTALGSLRCLQSLTIHVDVTYDRRTPNELYYPMFSDRIFGLISSL